MKTHYLIPIFIALVFASCSQNKPVEKADTKHPEAQSEEPIHQDYKIVPAPKSTEYPDAKLERMTYKNGQFTFKYSGTDYKLGDQTPDALQMMCANSAKGQHIHLIVDDQPYSAHYTPEFDYDLSDGEHVILAFLSRSYHESIKNGQSYIAQKVTVKNGSFVKTEDIKEPMIFYSRPKGKYVGKSETDKVMLDFFIINAELGEGKYAVVADVNHYEPFQLLEWRPYFIENLPMGKNTVKLTLIDPENKYAETPFNPIQRSFELMSDPAIGE